MTPKVPCTIGRMENQARRPRVLVVEDEPLSAQMITAQLEALGYAVECALDGNRAVTMACTSDYDALLLDLNLPAYDGVEVLQIVRRRTLKRRAKVVVVTGDVGRTRARDLNREGIDAYLTKPVDIAILAAELYRLVDPRGAA